MTRNDLVVKMAAIIGCSTDDTETLLAAAEHYRNYQRKEFFTDRLYQIVRYLAPDRDKGGWNKPAGASRTGFGLKAPHPLLPQWWWNEGNLKDEYPNEDGSINIYLHSYAGGGEMSDDVRFTVPAAWMDNTITNDDVFSLIDAHAEESRKVLEEIRESALKEEKQKNEAKERAEYERLKEKFA